MTGSEEGAKFELPGGRVEGGIPTGDGKAAPECEFDIGGIVDGERMLRCQCGGYRHGKPVRFAVDDGIELRQNPAYSRGAAYRNAATPAPHKQSVRYLKGPDRRDEGVHQRLPCLMVNFPMSIVTAFQAKTRFGELLDRVARGEEVVITRHAKPVARIVPEGRPSVWRSGVARVR